MIVFQRSLLSTETLSEQHFSCKIMKVCKIVISCIRKCYYRSHELSVNKIVQCGSIFFLNSDLANKGSLYLLENARQLIQTTTPAQK